MVCKLCLKDKKLLRKSHIIPDFMYKDIFDGKHRLHEVEVTTGSILKDKLRQTGGYENQILCQTCDNKVLGELERYASKVLYGDAPKRIQSHNDAGFTCTYCEDINYSKFKLFLLSVLWRASISQLPIFKNVNLGPHEDKMRQMIFHSNPDEPNKYPCIMVTYLNLKKLPHQFIGSPGLSRDGDDDTYLFLIGGILYIFFVSYHNLPSWVDSYAINSKGELRLIHMTERIASSFINKFLGMDFIDNE